MRLPSLLLEAGADLNAQDAGGWTALMKPNAFGYCDVIRLLQSRGADIALLNNAGDYALAWAANEVCAELLTEARSSLRFFSSSVCPKSAIDTIPDYPISRTGEREPSCIP
jgi:ankyrin repeat protein